MRKLATIRRISKIDPIPNKDFIGLAHVDGWNVIVNKNDFRVGDLCVYCEIDSVLPDKPEFEQVKKRTNLRIRTLKMSGVVSQGICFPLSILPKGNYKVGDDVTIIMGVTQYVGNMDIEKEVLDKKGVNYPKWLMKIPFIGKWFTHKKEYKGFPTFVTKTDENRIQNMPEIIDIFKENPQHKWYIHEKLDGQSGTFVCVRKKGLFKETYEFMVCSRNLRLFQKDNRSYWKVSEKYNIKEKLIRFLKDNKKANYICVQGECVGQGVQGNKYQLPDNDFYVFTVQTDFANNPVCGNRMTEPDIDKFCVNYGFKRVPEIDGFDLSKMTMEDIIAFADGKSKINKNTMREGIVVRDDTVSFKVISNKFLLKYD